MICKHSCFDSDRLCGKPAVRFVKVVHTQHEDFWRSIGVGNVSVHGYCEDHFDRNRDCFQESLANWKREEISRKEAEALLVCNEIMEEP